jgi:hypothetical protein
MRSLTLGSLILLLLAAANACGGAGGGASEATPDVRTADDADVAATADDADVAATADDAADAGCPPHPPEPAAPAPPDLPECLDGPVGCARLQSWTCPAGWLAVPHASVVDADGQPFAWCAPPPLPRLRAAGGETAPDADGTWVGAATCAPGADGTWPVLGQAECAPFGSPCPVGDFPTDLGAVAGAVWYVKAGAAGGDGRTPGAPLATIGAALALAAPGDTVLVATGTYAEALAPTRDVTIRGVCPRGVTLAAPGPFTDREGGAVRVAAPVQVELRDLRLGGAQVGLLVADADAAVTARALWIDGATKRGVLVAAGALDATDLLVTDIVPPPAGFEGAGSLGRGLQVEAGAELRLTRALFERCLGQAVAVYDPGTEASFVDVAIRDTRASSDHRAPGSGIEVWDGAAARLERVLLHRNTRMAVVAATPGTAVTATDVAVVDVASFGGERPGWGVAATQGGTAVLERVLVVGAHWGGVDAGETGSHIEVADVVIRATGTVPAPGEGAHAGGLNALWGGQVAGARVLVEGSGHVGVFVGGAGDPPPDQAGAAGPGAALAVSDLVVRESRRVPVGPDLDSGLGILLGESGSAELTRVFVEGCDSAHVSAAGAGASLVLSAATVRGEACGGGPHAAAMGIVLVTGAQAAVHGGRIDCAARFGVFVAGEGATATLEDLVVADTAPKDDGTFGTGLAVGLGAVVTLERAVLERNHTSGVGAIGAGARVTLRDLVVRDTLPDEAGAFGRGLNAQHGPREPSP